MRRFVIVTLLLMAAVAEAGVARDGLRLLLREDSQLSAKSGADELEALQHSLGEGIRLRPSFDLSSPAKWSLPIPSGAASALDQLHRWYAVEVDDPVSLAGVEARLRRSMLVSAVEPVYLHETTIFPDDALLSSQTYLGVANVFPAYDVVRGSDADVLVAVVDGGTDWRHEDLRGNVWDRPGEIEGNGLDDDGNGYVDDLHGWSFPTATPDPTGLPATPSNGAHGTHIAGTISAVSDNGLGVAGMSWNARLLLVNAGDPERDGTIRYGPEGLLYAALSGADVINASWGRTGLYSQFEADVVRAVQALGSLIVAAAGNGIDGEAFYPAFYPGVLSVARSGLDERASAFSNADYWIDVAAPGTLIFNTLPNNTYGSRGGTSQSAAVVSGIAALVKARHPEWSADAIREQIRWSTRPLRELSPERQYRFGTGQVDAHAAVTGAELGLHVVGLRLVDQDGDGLIEPGEMVTIQLELRNESRAVSDLKIRVLFPEADIVLLEDTVRLSVVAGSSDLSIVRGLSGWVPYTTPTGELTPLLVILETANRTVHEVFYPELLPLHVTLQTSRLEVSFTCTGKLGFSQVTRSRDPGGVGVRRPGGITTMLGGSLLIGDGPTRVADAVIAPRPQDAYEDFYPLRDDIHLLDGAHPIAREFVCTYSDRGGADQLGVRVTQRNIVFADQGRADLALSIYDIASVREDLSGLMVGVLVDWEMSQGTQDLDQVVFDAPRGLLYAADTGRADAERAGVAIVHAPGPLQASWLYDLPGEDESIPALYDPADLSRSLSDEALWDLLTDGRLVDATPVGGVAGVVSAGPFRLARGESTRMVLAYVVGAGRTDLQRQAEAARVAYEALEEGFAEGVPSRPRLLGAAPNPFNPRTELLLSLPQETRVLLDVYDPRGRHVVRLLDEIRRAGFHGVQWDGQDSSGRRVGSGVYHVRLQTGVGSDHASLTLLR